jgi:hypothetical protein
MFGSSSKSFCIACYKFWNKFKIEYSSNFKGVQTFLKKSDKFLKILSSHDILEYNFTLTHLYSNIGSFFTSGKNDLVKFHTQNSWPLRNVGTSNTNSPLNQNW